MTEVAWRLDRLPLTRLHVMVGLVCACAFGADMMEISVGSALTAVFSLPPHLIDPRRLGWLISSVYIGAVIGGPVMGGIADRYGLKRLIVWALLWVGLTSLLAGSTRNITLLLTFRLLSGLALGGIPPLVIAFLTGIAPRRHRGLYIFSVCAVSFLAAPAAVFLIRWLTPLKPFGVEGWRWPFLVAGLLSLGAAAALLPLPESPRWLFKAGLRLQAQAACDQFGRSKRVWGSAIENDQKAPTTAMARSSTLSVPYPTLNGPKARFALMAVLFFLTPWGILGFSILTGPILLARGYDLRQALLFVGLSTFGPSISTLMAGMVIDRLQRRTALIASCLLLLLASVVFFNATAKASVAVALAAFGIGSGFFIPLMTTYAAEVFGTGTKGSPISAAWAINRIGSVLVPIGLLPLLHQNGLEPVAVCIYSALGLSVTLLIWLGPRQPKAK